MYQNHHFEKVSNGQLCAIPKTRAYSVPWKAPAQIGNAFAFLILALCVFSGPGQAAAESAGALLDLNQATSAELEGLPGIGAVKAAAILAVRDARGGFESMEQLESVRGVGPALVTKLRPLVRLGKSTARPGASRGKSSAKPGAGTGSAAKTSAAAPNKKANQSTR